MLAELLEQRPTVIALQETKLSTVDTTKRNSFLPARLRSLEMRPSDGASGGILTAWAADTLTLASTITREFTLTTKFTLNADGSAFFVTNVYAPTLCSEKLAFLAEIADLASQIDGPWLLLGDYNLTREPSDKNNDHFNLSEARQFNDLINILALLEIPLVDRAYTWSNKRETPTLVRLDRCLVNLDWDLMLPNTCLSSLTRFVSDHVSLLLTATTKVPKGECFRFENTWLSHEAFKAKVKAAINGPVNGPASRFFVKRLKTCRSVCRSWARHLRPIDRRENDTMILVDALDSLEECRSLSLGQKQNLDALPLKVSLQFEENASPIGANASI